jgi:hypothetical protein
MGRRVEIDLAQVGDREWEAEIDADGEQWAKVSAGDRMQVVTQALHYARVHLSDPRLPFDELLRSAPCPHESFHREGKHHVCDDCGESTVPEPREP